jgi:hypothetical protein
MKIHLTAYKISPFMKASFSETLLVIISIGIIFSIPFVLQILLFRDYLIIKSKNLQIRHPYKHKKHEQNDKEDGELDVIILSLHIQIILHIGQ